MKACIKHKKTIHLTDVVPGLGLTIEQVIAGSIMSLALSGLLSVFVVIYQNVGAV